jgi:hypothetical protein
MEAKFRPAFENFDGVVPTRVIRIEYVDPTSGVDCVRWLEGRGGDKLIAEMRRCGYRLISYTVYECSERHDYD